MKFTINRDLLLDALNNVSRGLSSKTPMPVLTGIKIEVSKEDITLITTNREISVKVVLNKVENIDILEDGVCVVPGKYFIDIIKKLEGDTVEFTLFDANTIKIISERTTFTLISLDYSNYPNINFSVNSEPIILGSKVLKNYIRQTAFAAGVNESRMILTGVCLETNQNKLQMIATDSYRLAKKVSLSENPYPKTKIIIPSKSIEELSKILEDESEDVKVYFANNRALFEYKNISFITRLIEGTFPDTSSIIPTEHIVEIKFNKPLLLSTVDRASLFTTQNNGSIIKMSTDANGVVQIASISTEIGKVVEEIVPLNIDKKGHFQIAFSAKYFLEAIKAFDGTEIVIKFTGELKPFLLTSPDDENFVQVILPVRYF
ncbi:MAG: DNA polymerase III subunit beta [Bacilli bacterium]|nr:DNA polymerase III subunit beta [Bacilli bacterium]